MLRIYRPERTVVGFLEVYGGIGIGLLFTARFVPLAKLPFWRCTLREVTGIPCPSCGMTRAFDWFMRGRLLDALEINPLGFALAVLAVVGAAYLAAARLRPPRLRMEPSARGAFWMRTGVIAVLACNWSYLIVRTLAAK
jgi:hypothetical protein